MTNKKVRTAVATIRRIEIAEVTLGSYADPESTNYEIVKQFLRDVERASLPDIVGATSAAWAVCHATVHRLIEEGHVTTDQEVSPWEYVWKGK